MAVLVKHKTVDCCCFTHVSHLCMHAKCPKVNKTLKINKILSLKKKKIHGLIWRHQLIQVASDTNWCVDEVISSIGVVSMTMGWSYLRGTKSSQLRGRNWVKIIGFLWFVFLEFIIFIYLDHVQRFFFIIWICELFCRFSLLSGFVNYPNV